MFAIQYAFQFWKKFKSSVFDIFFLGGFFRCGIVVGRFEIVLGRLKIVADRCGSLWVVVDRCGSFRVLVTTYYSLVSPPDLTRGQRSTRLWFPIKYPLI